MSGFPDILLLILMANFKMLFFIIYFSINPILGFPSAVFYFCSLYQRTQFIEWIKIRNHFGVARLLVAEDIICRLKAE